MMKKINAYTLFLSYIFVMLILLTMVLFLQTSEISSMATTWTDLIAFGLLTGLTGFLGLLFKQALIKKEQNEFTAHQNDETRKAEKESQALTHQYRMETLKWDKLHQIITAISEKTETKATEDNKTKTVVTITMREDLMKTIENIKLQTDKI